MSLKYLTVVKTLSALYCRQGGQSYARIAKSAGVTPQTVRRWISKAGLTKAAKPNER